MKRYLAILLILCLLFCACGRQSEDEDIQNPVSFYYHSNLESEDGFSNIIVAEIREGSGYEDATLDLLDLYLKGPVYGDLVNPYPAGVCVDSLAVYKDHMSITLSKEFSQLSGLELTLACTCLSMTLYELYDCSSVEISAKDSLLDGQDSVVYEKQDLLLSDDGYASPED